MKVVYSVEGIDARSLLVVIGIGASGYQIPSLTEQLYAERLNVEVVLLVLPIAVIGLSTRFSFIASTIGWR